MRLQWTIHRNVIRGISEVAVEAEAILAAALAMAVVLRRCLGSS